MTSTEHYLVPSELAPGEPMEEPPIRQSEEGHFVTDLPEPEAPAPFMALPLDVILAALRRLVIPTRDISADDWAAWRVNLNGPETSVVANRQPGRKKLTITNLAAGGGASAYLSSRTTLAPAGINTWPLPAGATFTLESTGPVYGCTDTGQTPQLGVVAEYDTGAGGEL